MSINLKRIGQFTKMQDVLRLSLISLVFACSTLCSKGDEAVLSVDNLAKIIAASESQLRNLTVTARQTQMFWDESMGQWKDAGDANLTMWLDGKPDSKMRIDFQHRRSRWINGAKPFFTDSCVITYNGQVGQVLERVPDKVLLEHKNVCPRGRITGDRPNMSVADCGSGWLASLYGVEEGRKMRLSELIELIKGMTNSAGFSIVSTNYIFSTNYNGIACVQLTLKEYPVRTGRIQDSSCNTQGWGLAQARTDWFLDPSRNYALLGYKIVMPCSGSSHECVVGELIEPAPGVFYPKKAAFYAVGRDGKPKSLITYEGLNIVANDPNFSDDIFSMQWPTGAMVRDEVFGTTFKISLPFGEETDRFDSQISAKQKTVNLTDGRVFAAEVVANDGHRLQFRANGWNYNLPAYMIATNTLVEPVKVQRVEITKDSIVTPEGKLTSFQELMTFLDKRASRSYPVILVLADGASSWSETRRQEFGRAYGDMHSRPNVGVEGPWPEKWLPGGLPGDPGRKPPKK